MSLSENVDQGLDDGHGPCFRPPIEEVEDDADDEELKELEDLSSVQVKESILETGLGLQLQNVLLGAPQV